MTPDIINDALSKLKNENSSGPDNISTNLLKSIMPIVSWVFISAIYLICRLKLVIFQPSLKLVKSFQSSRLESDKFTNYRPISLLSSFSKLLEKVAGNKIMKYLNRLKL